jgi:hypothetical protein
MSIDCIQQVSRCIQAEYPAPFPQPRPPACAQFAIGGWGILQARLRAASNDELKKHMVAITNAKQGLFHTILAFKVGGAHSAPSTSFCPPRGPLLPTCTDMPTGTWQDVFQRVATSETTAAQTTEEFCLEEMWQVRSRPPPSHQ